MSGSIAFQFTPDEIVKRIGGQPATVFADVRALFPEVDLSSLMKQLSLHLPQYSRSENMSSAFVKNEALRLGFRLQLLRKQDMRYIPSRAEVADSPQLLQFEQIDDQIARSILEHFHYLLSFRDKSIHLGLKMPIADRWPIAIVTLSPFDLRNIQSELPIIDGREANPLVLSRAFAFDVAPRNTMSYLLSKAREWIATNMPEINILVTYLNPNVGFTGASYKADNWTLLGREGGTRYFYLELNYVTDRWLYNRFGQAPFDMKESWKTYGISISKHTLLPLELYVRGIAKPQHNSRIRATNFQRWKPVWSEPRKG